MKTPQYKLYLIATGIKKRCRNPDRHNFTLGYIPFGEFNRQELINRAFDRLKDEMKSTTKAYLSIDYVEIEKDSWGTSEEWMPFDDRHQRIELMNNTAGNQAVTA